MVDLAGDGGGLPDVRTRAPRYLSVAGGLRLLVNRVVGVEVEGGVASGGRRGGGGGSGGGRVRG